MYEGGKTTALLQATWLGWGTLTAMFPLVAVGFLAFPIAFAVYTLTLAALSAAMKALLVGKVMPNVHK